MAAISGFLDLGTAISGSYVVTPPGGTNYAPQPITFTQFVGGVTVNSVSSLFGPVSGSWDTLTVFGVSDTSLNPIWTGTLSTPFTPVNGQIVAVPAGNIQLTVGAQFAIGPGGLSPVVQGPLTTGEVALSTGAFTMVLPSGARTTLSLQNQSAADYVQLIIGGATAPVTGTAAAVIIPPYQSWPTSNMNNFVSTDFIWAICGQPGTVLSYLTG